ncbi:hypothetical protein HK102_005629 [Quaeritorhiza haematococci]|nr:hypothetical protein HK102_005629 [Quaeritorhiza haematococci]
MALPADILREIGVWLEDSQDFINLGVALHHVWEPSVQGQRLLLKHGIDEIHYHLPDQKCKDIVRYLSREDPDYPRRIFDGLFQGILDNCVFADRYGAYKGRGDLESLWAGIETLFLTGYRLEDKHRKPGSKFRKACLECITFNHGRVFRLLIDTGQIDWTESPRALEAAYGDVRTGLWLIRCGWRVSRVDFDEMIGCLLNRWWFVWPQVVELVGGLWHSDVILKGLYQGGPGGFKDISNWRLFVVE